MSREGRLRVLRNDLYATVLLGAAGCGGSGGMGPNHEDTTESYDQEMVHPTITLEQNLNVSEKLGYSNLKANFNATFAGTESASEDTLAQAMNSINLADEAALTQYRTVLKND